LDVRTRCSEDSIQIKVDGETYKIAYPTTIWRQLGDDARRFIADHIAFLATNYLPLLLGRKGAIYDTKLPMFECFSFKSMMYDLPSSAILDDKETTQYLRDFFNLDFVFESDDPIVWNRGFTPEKRAIISFTSGKDSLLTLAVCRELELEPILINVVEPSNTHEHKYKSEILQSLNEEFGIKYHVVQNDIGIFHDSTRFGLEETSLGWGNQLLYYLFLYLPFVYHYKARYLFFGNELSCDKEIVGPQSFRANFCYDQSSHWTRQMDMLLRNVTLGSSRVGSLVGPLNELAVMKCLHEGFPQLAKYQMSCFCDVPSAETHRWCCSCSKCARNYAFLAALGIDPKRLGFWRDMFSEDCLKFFPLFDGQETFGFDKSGLGRDEQQLAFFLASMHFPENEFLQNLLKRSKYICEQDEKDISGIFKEDYSHYLATHDYQAIPKELRDRVYQIYSDILSRNGMV